MRRSIVAALMATLAAGHSLALDVPAAARAELAPTGTMRAGMNLGNALFTTRDRSSGELRGVAVDLMRELAARLGLSVEFVVYASPGDVADAAAQGTWDVAVLAIEPARAERITFSGAITGIEATYLVSADSPLRSVAQVDAAGVRIATPAKAGYELYLTRTLRHAELVRTQGTSAAIDQFNQRKVDALAGLRPALLDSMPRTPGARLLDGNFVIVHHGIAVPRARPAAAALVESFVNEIRAAGFVARSIERHGVQGLAPAH